MSRLNNNARQLALCLVDGDWSLQGLSTQLTTLLDGGPPEPRQLAARLLLLGGSDRSPRLQRIVDLLIDDEAFRKHFASTRSIRLRPCELCMQPMPGDLVTLPLPPIATRRELAQWLGLSDAELDWFSAIDRRYARSCNVGLEHYRYEWRDRSSGIPRLLEKPKQRLKSLQKLILRGILDRVPLHDATHGFRRRRSILSCAEPHVGQEVFFRMDLSEFFLSISRARVEGIFRMVGYPQGVASSLAGLCTHRTQLSRCGGQIESLGMETRQRLIDWHLPQGAPTSPVLANLVAWRMDARLAGLARHLGGRYTRYADDLAFSGSTNLYRQRSFVEPLIGSIALEEGFHINFRKTRWMRASQRQQFCGITLNKHPNPGRRNYDRLKAELYNCARFGPASQNRDGHPDYRRHLEGRVSHASFLNPRRGEKLKVILREIDWRL